MYQEGRNTQVNPSNHTPPVLTISLPISPSIFVDLRATGRVMCMCNKNSRAPLLANQRNQVDVSCAQLTQTHTKTAQTHKRSTHSPSDRRLFLRRSLCQGTRKSRGRTKNNNRVTLCKWVELREECAALCQYSCLLPCRFNRIPRVSPFDIGRPLQIGVSKWSRPL